MYNTTYLYQSNLTNPCHDLCVFPPGIEMRIKYIALRLFRVSNWEFSFQVAVWSCRLLHSLLVLLQISGNGIAIWIVSSSAKSKVPHGFILSLATSDFVSGINSIVSVYREDLGRMEFHLPKEWFQWLIRTFICSITYKLKKR